ncbi:MAG: serine dehydratase subunit alpha family protein [Lachnospiraceae bacterium]|nr:serine dehydratase subunit alpha family protein [Lachnospiraceae bacterium]
MDRRDTRYQQYLQILREELIPAMGCTEPIAIAYGAARARALLGEKPEKILVEASGNLIKNVKSVVVPNTGGLKGIEAAAAAGALAGKPEKELEVIADIAEEQKVELAAFLEQKAVEVRFLDSEYPLDLIVTEEASGHCTKVRIAQYHTNVVLEEADGQVVSRKEVSAREEGLTDRSILNVKDILDFAESVDTEEVRDILDRQIACNMAIAEEGIRNSYGANVGSVLLNLYGNEIHNRAKAMAAAGSDARMSGCELPVVINSGSGNQGITVSVPVIEYARELQVGQEKLYRALVLSNLLAIHQKTGIGRLSAYCGAVSAGSAAGAAIAYLYGGDYKTIAHCLVNSLAVTSGMICDGAKSSCAAKIAFSIESALLGYEMYKMGNQFRDGEGIVRKGVENTIANVGRLGKEGMRETDREILKMMTEAQC